MSSHPVGPWTETLDFSTSASFTIGAVTIVENPSQWGAGHYTRGLIIDETSSSRRGSTFVRTGVNNGPPPYHVPSNATLQKLSVDAWGVVDATLYGALSGINIGAIVHCAGGTIPRFPTAYGDAAALTTARNAAYQKLAQKLSEAVVDGGVFTGELKETSRTIGHAFDALTHSTNNAAQTLGRVFKNVKGRNLAAAAEEVSSLYLEYNFGVKPIVTDISNIMDGVAQLGNSDSLFRKVSGTYVVDNYVHEDNTVSDFYWPALYIDGSSVSKTTTIVKFGGTLDLRNPPSQLNFDNARFGASPFEFAPTVWNLYPYTWAVDYVSNVGDFANALAFRRGVLSDCWTVEIQKSVTTTNYSLRTIPGEWTLSGEVTPSKSSSFAFNRSPASLDTFVPSLEFKVPEISQVANVAALVTNKLAQGAHRNELRNPQLSSSQLETFVNLIKHNMR